MPVASTFPELEHDIAIDPMQILTATGNPRYHEKKEQERQEYTIHV